MSARLPLAAASERCSLAHVAICPHLDHPAPDIRTHGQRPNAPSSWPLPLLPERRCGRRHARQRRQQAQWSQRRLKRGAVAVWRCWQISRARAAAPLRRAFPRRFPSALGRFARSAAETALAWAKERAVREGPGHFAQFWQAPLLRAEGSAWEVAAGHWARFSIVVSNLFTVTRDFTQENTERSGHRGKQVNGKIPAKVPQKFPPQQVLQGRCARRALRDAVVARPTVSGVLARFAPRHPHRKVSVPRDPALEHLTAAAYQNKAARPVQPLENTLRSGNLGIRFGRMAHGESRGFLAAALDLVAATVPARDCFLLTSSACRQGGDLVNVTASKNRDIRQLS